MSSTIKVTVKSGAIRNNYLYLPKEQLDFFPKSVMAAESEKPERLLTLQVEGIDEKVETYVLTHYQRFHDRTIWRSFYEANGIVDQDEAVYTVVIERLSDYEYTVRYQP